MYSEPHNMLPEEESATLLMYARTLANDEPEAEDLVQETILRFLTADVARILSPKAWLRQTLRNLHLQRRRTDERRLRRERVRAHPEAAPDTAELVASRCSWEQLQHALRDLTPVALEALELRYLEGLTPRELSLIHI